MSDRKLEEEGGMFAKGDLTKPKGLASSSSFQLDFYGIQKPLGAEPIEKYQKAEDEEAEDEDEDEDGASEGQLAMDMGKSLTVSTEAEAPGETLTAREALMRWADGE